MATLTLNYDASNSVANKIIDIILSMDNVFSIKKTAVAAQKTGIDEALEDIKKGRVYAAQDAKSLIKQCLQ